MGEALLAVSALEAGYGRVPVLDRVDLTVGEGEIVALVGGNGAGKTTLLRAVSGQIRPGGGTVRWRGRDVAGQRPEAIVGLGIAHVPEGRRLFAGLTVRENLLVGAHHRRDADVETDVAHMLELFPRLAERLDRPAGQLSGGEQQMCAVARGLMGRPALLMIDELSLGLAPNVVDTLLERLATIAAAGTAVLVVEQDIDAALDLAARGYVLENGRIVLEGPSPALRTDPRVRNAYLGTGGG
jgi:branched-chain amino acid transport system ATP-binding protein